MTDDQDTLDVRRVLSGEVEAFEGIVRRWQVPLVNLAYRFCRDQGDAEEIAQDVFVKVYRSLGGWRGESRFSTWMFALALNVCRSRMRRFAPRWVDLEEAGALGHSRDSEDREKQARAQQVRQAVSALPPKYREAMVLFYLNEMNLEESAKSLGLPEGTLKARLHRGRELLRGKLSSLLAEEPMVDWT